MEFRVVRNDITNMEVDAITLPANTKLVEGPGASTVIFGKAGRELVMEDCARQGEQKVGNAVATPGHNLPAKHIIHAVVPRWNEDEAEECCALLAKAYLSTLCLADELRCTSLAIPLLSSGHNRFSVDQAIETAVTSIEVFSPSFGLSDVTLVVFDYESYNAMVRLGYDVEAVIDEGYVRAQDDSYKPFEQQQHEEELNTVATAAADGVNVVGQGVVEGAQFAGQMVMEGAQVAGQAIAEGAQAAGQALAEGTQVAGRVAEDAVHVAGDFAKATGDFINEHPEIQAALFVAGTSIAAGVVGNKKIDADIVRKGILDGIAAAVAVAPFGIPQPK